MYDLLYGAKLTIIYEGGNSFFTYFFCLSFCSNKMNLNCKSFFFSH